MKKAQLELIIICVCVIIIVFSIAGNLKNKAAKKITLPSAAAPAPAASEQAASIPIAPAVTPAKIIKAQQERTKLNWGRDPFALSSDIDKENQKTELQLKGISFGKDKNAFAFINNEIVKKGDKVSDYEIVEVEKDKVLLRKGSRSFYLALPEEEIKMKGAR